MTNTDKEILDILKGFMSDDEIKDAIEKGNIKLGAEDSIEKAEKKEDSEDETEVTVKVEQEEESEDDEEKDTEEKSKKKEDKVEKSEETPKEEKIEKSDNSDLIKSFEDRFTQVDELKKSISGLTEMLSNMNAKIEAIGNEAPEPKSVRQVQYFEKGETLKDEEDRTILSVSKDREQIGEIMLKSMSEEKDDLMKGQLESDLMNVIGGNSLPTENVCKYLYENKGIRIVK